MGPGDPRLKKVNSTDSMHPCFRKHAAGKGFGPWLWVHACNRGSHPTPATRPPQDAWMSKVVRQVWATRGPHSQGSPMPWQAKEGTAGQ